MLGRSQVTLRGLALHPSTLVDVVILLHIVDVPLVLALPGRVAVLQVSVDVQVIVHGVRLIWFVFPRQVVFKLLQLVWGEEVLFWKDHLEVIEEELILNLVITDGIK